jgi:hypothetical protein
MATIFVPSSGTPTANMAALQAAVNSAAPGDTVTVQAGGLFDGTLTLPSKALGSAIITVRTDQLTSLPAAGSRVSPADAVFMPRVRIIVNNAPGIRTCTPSGGVANGYTIIGFEVVANAFAGGNLVEFGNADGSLANKQDTPAKVPADLTLDRCYLHGNPFTGQKRGLGLDCLRGTVVGCYISDCWGLNQDTQAIAGSNGLGTYTITNNYLEGAGENFLMGGDDPRIPGLVPTTLLFTRNDVAIPPAWRNPILAYPTGVVTTVGSGGTLPTATYTYTVVSQRLLSYNNLPIRSSSPPSGVARAVTLGQSVTVSWTAVTGATTYLVYRTGPAGVERFSVTSPAFVDTGQAGLVVTGPPTTSGNVRAVKNIFELKNFDGAIVRGNRFFYNWLESQVGYAIVLTPVNQNGGNPATVVANVLFEYNWIAHTAGAFNLTAHDAQTPSQLSQRAHDITIRHNLVTDMGPQWGGYVREFQLGTGLGANPREGVLNVTIDHNTILGTGMNSAIYFYAYNTATGLYDVCPNFRYTNNITRRGDYGVFGDTANEGNGSASTTGALEAYAPGGTFAKNAIVGINLTLYPTGQYNPTEATLQAQFVNYAGGNYRLLATSLYAGQGTDGADLGANLDAIDAAYAGSPTTGPPVLSLAVSAVGGAGTLNIITTPDCVWTATSSVSWITFPDTSSGTGLGLLTFLIAGNATTSSRVGVITIQDQAGATVTTVVITQAAQAAVTIAVPVGGLLIVGSAPVRSLRLAASSTPATLTLASALVTVVVGAPTSVVRACPAATVTLAGQAPRLSTVVATPVGALLLAGLTPTSREQVVTQPGVGTLALAGLLPVRQATGTASPGVAALVLVGRLPTQAATLSAAPGLGTLTLTGLAPLLRTIESPAVDALLLDGYAPTVRLTLASTPAPASLLLSGLAPGSRLAWHAQPAAAALLLTGLSGGAPQTNQYSTGAGELQLVGLAPSITGTFIAAMGAGTLTLAPTTSTLLENARLLPAQGVLALGGLSPTRIAAGSASPTSGAIALLGAAPTLAVTNPTVQTADPLCGALDIVGLAPTLDLLPIVILTPDPAALVFAGLAPTLGPCAYTVSPLVVTASAAAVSLPIAVTTASSCAWTAVANDAWLVVSVSGGIGNGTFTVDVAAYTDPSGPRTGTLTVAGETVTIVQLSPGCTFTVSPGSLVVPGVGVSGTLTIVTGGGCAWTAVSGVPWVTLGVVTGSGSATVPYVVAPNPGLVRTGTLTVAGFLIPVTQAAIPPSPTPGDPGTRVTGSGCAIPAF